MWQPNRRQGEFANGIVTNFVQLYEFRILDISQERSVKMHLLSFNVVLGSYFRRTRR